METGTVRGPVSACQPGGPLLDAGALPGDASREDDGRIAQLVEQLTLNQRVQGSSPCAPTIDINDLATLHGRSDCKNKILVTRLVTFRQA